MALNFSRAVATINNLGAVIGDVNESVALVDHKGLVTIIDSDSFQYRSGGQTYRCLVGKPEYTPPELRGLSLEKIDRTVNHDAFGVAVIIFEILFMGRHPFSGVYHGAGEQRNIAQAIEEGRFAYSLQKAQTQMEPPPHVPLLADIPLEVAGAFQRAFESPVSGVPTRPTATEWVSLLDRMEKGVIECKTNAAHYYSGSARQCPWCRFEAATGAILFISPRIISRSAFKLEDILLRIERIQSPGPAPNLATLMPIIGQLEPSQALQHFKRRVWERRGGGLATAALAIILMASGIPLGFFLLIPACVLLFRDFGGAAAIKEQHSRSEAAWKSSVASWNRSAGPGRFDEKKSELLRTAASYGALPSVEQDMLRALDNKKRGLQMRKHLEAHKIGRAKIDGVGDGRKMTLRSFGIETAWDVSHNIVKGVPGFGPALTDKLMRWRQSVERKFAFIPNAPTDPNDIARVQSQIAMRRTTIETDFINGMRELENIRAETLARRNDVRQYRAAYLGFRQAEADMALL